MKILVVSPPTFGKNVGGAAKDILATPEMLQALGHTVSFWAIATPFQHEPLIEEYSRSVGIPVRTYLPDLSRWSHWVSSILFKSFGYADRAAYVFLQLSEDSEFQNHVAMWEPDVILFFCSYGWTMAHFAHQRAIPSVFRSHNYEPSFFWEALSLKEQCNPLNWIRYFAKMVGERNAARFSDAIATIPFEDVWRYERWSPNKTITLTLTYPSKSIAEPWVHEHKNPLDVFYLGASYLVSFHLRGVQALIEDIAPAVARAAPGAFRFHICGSKLPKYLEKQCDGESIVYQGYVPDLDVFLNDMDIGAFPVWTGKVMKGKVFESMCRAFPVVIPENCRAGYPLKDKEEVIMAETNEEFVEAILSLRDDALRRHISEGAVSFAKTHFGRDAVLRAFAGALELARA